MATIRKKAWRDLFEKVWSGEKTFDVRLADFEVNEGDILILEEWDERTHRYTGRKIETRVGYILKTKDVSFWSREDIDTHGLQVIQLTQQNNKT